MKKSRSIARNRTADGRPRDATRTSRAKAQTVARAQQRRNKRARQGL